jgi:hypothetical protein
MGAEYEYFGNKIVQLGSNYYIGYINGTDKEIIGSSLNDVKEKIDALRRKQDIEDLYRKIDNHTDCSRAAFDFFYNMIVSFHSCEGAAIMRMQDYCNAKNI